MRTVLLYLSAIILGGAGAWVVAKWGKQLSLIDKANHRSSHDGVVPKGGGIGILAAFLLASWVLGLPILFWMCVGLVSVLSLYGDRHEIPPKVRLCIQFLAAFFVVITVFPGFSSILSIFRSPFSVFCLLFFSVFVVGTANYYNFMGPQISQISADYKK